MRYQLQFRAYRRKFRKPVRFGSDLADFRDGVLLRVEGDDGRVGYGEVAPIESFGSESVQHSLALLRSFCGTLREGMLADLDPKEHPCTRYALTQAMRNNEEVRRGDGFMDSEIFPTSQLYQHAPSSEADGRNPVRGGVYKIKIAHCDGTDHQEHAQVVRWAKRCFENGARLRLDANEGLNVSDFWDWITLLEPYHQAIEFIEQPLDRWDLEGMAALAEQSPVPIALDESLSLLRGQWDWATVPDCWLYIVKPSLGDSLWIPAEKQDRIIWSSVFETGVGFQQLLELPRTPWFPGFDTQQAFISDGLEYPKNPNGYQGNQINPAQLWKILG